MSAKPASHKKVYRIAFSPDSIILLQGVALNFFIHKKTTTETD